MGTICEHARAMLLNTQAKCPKVISTYLWSYVVNYTVNIVNSIPVEATGKNLETLLTGTDTDSRLKKTSICNTREF